MIERTEIYKKVAVMLHILRQGRPLRQVIDKRSEKNLQLMAAQQPDETAFILDQLFRLHSLSQTPDKISVAKGLSASQVIEQLGSGLGPWLALMGEGRELAFKKLKLKGELPEPADDFAPPNVRLQEYEEVQTLTELKRSFAEENRSFLEKDEEIAKLTLFNLAWRTRIMLYKMQETLAAEKKLPEVPEENLGRPAVYLLVDLLRQVSVDFPYWPGAPISKIEEAGSLILAGNFPAADATLVSLTDQLDKELEKLEGGRLRDELAARQPVPDRLLDAELLELAKKRYKISFTTAGLWMIPEKGFRKVGPVLQGRVIDHSVSEDKVVRREQHQIDGITEEIGANAHFYAVLTGLAELFTCLPEQVEYEPAQTLLARGFLAYEHGQVRQKFKVKLMVKLALELVGTAARYREKGTQKRLLGFAAAMLRLSARQLLARNDVLGNQLRHIVVKQQVAMAIITRNLVRDNNLRALSESLTQSLTNRDMINWPPLPIELRRLVVEARNALTIDETTEPGIKSAAERLGNLVGLFAKITRLIGEKRALKRRIDAARHDHRQVFRGLGETGENAVRTGDRAIAYTADLLKEIERINEAITFTIAQAAKKALLIRYDLAHKNDLAESVADQQKWLEKELALFNAIGRLDATYQIVIDARGNEIGVAHPSDARSLKLRTVEAQFSISY